MSIDAFIDALAETAVSANITNPYSRHTGSLPQNKIRRENLRAYLNTMAARKPHFLLVGEAPGYRGARLTGIPFFSPHSLPLLQTYLGIPQLTTPSEWPHLQKEASATIMWKTLRQVTAVPLIWNAFPFHPHKPGKPQSNRRPTHSELARERPLFQQLLSLFEIQTFIAVGNTAANALTRWQFPHEKVRHPSHGGKNQFQQGLCNLLADDQ